MWACKTSVSLRHRAEKFIYPQSGGFNHHRLYLSLSFLASSISQSTTSSWIEHGTRGFCSTHFPLLIEHGRGKALWMSSQQLTQLKMAHLESKSIRIFHQKEEQKLGRDFTSDLSWNLRITCTTNLHLLQELRRQRTSYHNGRSQKLLFHWV